MKRREFIVGLGGSVAAWPFVARAQQSAMPVIGYLSAARESAIKALTIAFRQGLSEQGFVEGQNIEILYRWAETRYDLLPALAADLVSRRVEVIVTTAGTSSALAAKFATSAIPIVFQIGEDPIEAGLVANHNRPGGNVTGVTFNSGPLTAKRLEQLHELVPSTTQIGYLVNPTNILAKAQISELETAARVLGVQLVIQSASSPSEIEAALMILVGQRIGALLVDNDALFFTSAIN